MNDFLSFPFMGNYNCTYTTSSGNKVKMSIDALMKIMEDIPEKPRILTMPIQILKHKILPPNTIFISSDIAEALEQALEEKDK